MKGRIALYCLAIGILALGSTIYDHLVHGEPILLERLPMIFVIAPVLGAVVWLRWDWATAKRQGEVERRGHDGDGT